MSHWIKHMCWDRDKLQCSFLCPHTLHLSLEFQVLAQHSDRQFIIVTIRDRVIESRRRRRRRKAVSPCSLEPTDLSRWTDTTGLSVWLTQLAALGSNVLRGKSLPGPQNLTVRIQAERERWRNLKGGTESYSKTGTRAERWSWRDRGGVMQEFGVRADMGDWVRLPPVPSLHLNIASCFKINTGCGLFYASELPWTQHHPTRILSISNGFK